MTIIVGIDPGSRITGYGVIEQVGGKYRYVDSGCIRMGEEPAIPERLRIIFTGVSEIIRLYKPDQAAVEQVFLARNPDSALKLGQARGAAITALMVNDISVAEYSARQIKLAVVGTGTAQKTQVQHMVTRLLGLEKPPQADAADALAAAICHAHASTNLIRMAASGMRGSRAR
jgi:crossover junction endodeoxyribonuclease RuvC